MGSRLAGSLAETGSSVRCLVRDRSKAGRLEAAGLDLHEGDITDADSLAGAAKDIEVAYFLVHAMAGGKGFAERERIGALNFARMVRREGVRRVVYLGGLGDESKSKHLRSRHDTARALATDGPPLTSGSDDVGDGEEAAAKAPGPRLTTATVVTDPFGAEPFGIAPESFDEALRRALAEEGG